MAYRNGTYIAFDGLGQINPAKSDFRYYTAIQGWAAHEDIDFKYVNSHDKTAAVQDTSLRTTLEARIRERLASSKNVLVILSDKTRRSGSMLTYEIEKAVDLYNLPLICAYTDFFQVTAPRELSRRWPLALETRINTGTAAAIHIPFKKGALFDAIGQFTVHSNPLIHGVHFYSIEAHRELGCLT